MRDTVEDMSLSRVPCERSLRKLIPVSRKLKNKARKEIKTGAMVFKVLLFLGKLYPIKVITMRGATTINAMVRRSLMSWRITLDDIANTLFGDNVLLLSPDEVQEGILQRCFR